MLLLVKELWDDSESVTVLWGEGDSWGIVLALIPRWFRIKRLAASELNLFYLSEGT